MFWNHNKNSQPSQHRDQPSHHSIIDWVRGFFHGKINEIITLTDGIVISEIGKFVPAVIFASSLAVTQYLWNMEKESVVQDITHQLDSQLLDIAYPIQSKIQAYEQVLYGIHGLFDSSYTITRQEFNSYIKSLRIKENFPEIPWISISMYIPQEKLHKHVLSVQKEWFPTYGNLFPKKDNWEYAPVTYIEPFTGKNQNVFWFDNFSDEVRKESMQQSQSEYRPILSSPIALVQDSKKDAMNFVMYYPLYGKNIPHNTPWERAENIFWWAVIVFQIDKLISQISHNQFADINFQIYDWKIENEDKLLFNSHKNNTDVPGFWIKRTKIVNIANREWLLVLHSNAESERNMHHQGYVDNILYSGALVTFLLTLFSFIFIKTRREAIDAIEQQNRAIKEMEWAIIKKDLAIQQERATRMEMENLATHDSLTWLLNRKGFLDNFKLMISIEERKNRTFDDTESWKAIIALMFIDLDQFKNVNDTHGHSTGDELLKQVSYRMKQCLRGGDLIGRQWGDEFLVAISNIQSIDDIAHVASKITEILREPFIIDGNEIFIGSSIGIATYPNDATDIEDLQGCADLAMYSVKRTWRNGYHFYTWFMKDIVSEWQFIETALHHAIERKEFSMVFQPIIDVKSRSLIWMEALLRWKHPVLWYISPAKFIPIAEEKSEIIIAIERWTIWEVCKQVKEWKKFGVHVPKIGINLSAKQFLSESLIQDILDILESHWLDAKHIWFEITEWVLVQDFMTATIIIDKLTEMGFDLSIDDFGTGYSSLNYLNQFKVTKLKIDRSFIQNIHTHDWEQIISSIIQMAHGMGIKTVAEGVEKREQLDTLRELGCDYIQGYYFSRPESPVDIFPKLGDDYRFDPIEYINDQNI